MPLPSIAIDSHSNLTTKMKSTLIREAVQSNSTLELMKMNPVLFEPPFPHPFAVELYFRHLTETHPDIVCSIFFQNLNATPTFPISSLGIVRVLRSTAILLKKNASLPDTSILFPNYSNPILGIFDYTVEKQMTTIGVIVMSIMACKELKDFSGVFSVYNRAKQLAKDKRILEYDKRRLPDIVYGQTVIALAKLGAETQSYQLVCDMLEAGERELRICFQLVSLHAGCVFTPQTLDNIFLELSKIASHRILITILAQLHRHKITISTLALNAMINACHKAQDYSAALELYENKVSTQQIDEVGISVLIKCCDRLGLPVKAVRILLRGIFADKTISMALKERVFAILVNCKMPSLAVDLLLFLELQHSNAALIDDDLKLSLISGEYCNGFVDQSGLENHGAHARLRRLIDLPCRVSQSAGAYAAVIACLASAKLPREAYEVLDSFIRRGGAETSEMYVSVISGFRENRNVDAAELVLTQLKYRLSKANNILPSTSEGDLRLGPLRLSTAHYNALLAVYSAADMLADHKDRIIAEMKTLGMRWDAHTYSAIISGSAHEEVLSLWEEMIERNVPPTAVTVRRGLRAVVVKRATSVGLRIYHHAKKHGHDFEPYDYILLFTALRGGHTTNESIELLNEIHEENKQIPAICFYSVMLSLNRTNDWKRAIHLLLQMIRRGIPFDAKLFNLVMACCTRSNEFLLALKLFDQITILTKGKFKPNHCTFSIAVRAAMKSRDGAKALDLLGAMKDLGIPPATRVLSNIIACLDSCGMVEESVQVFNECVAKPDCDAEGMVSRSIIDLHGYSIHTSKAAILSALFAARDMKTRLENGDVVIITGMHS